MSYLSLAIAQAARINDPFYTNGTQYYVDQVNASGAWGYTNASNIVVAIIDTGLDLSHPDLQGNLWVNHGEIPGDGIDNDGNGEAAQGVAWLLRGRGVCTAAAWQFVRRWGECGAHYPESVECVGKLVQAHGQGGFCTSKTSMAVGERFTAASVSHFSSHFSHFPHFSHAQATSTTSTASTLSGAAPTPLARAAWPCSVATAPCLGRLRASTPTTTTAATLQA